MSCVFLATERALDRKVVVKMLAPELAAGLNADRFAREILITARLQHPHIVQILTTGTADGMPYYIMPYVRGRSLRDRINAGAVRFSEAISILRDIARALDYAHGEGVVHRDIKPENVLLAGSSAVVTDFGIAKAIAVASGRSEPSSEALTQLGMSLGTPGYIAPEQAVGGDVDHLADIYSWGVIAYELLAGRHVFAERTGAQQIVAAHIAETPKPLRDIAPQVPDAVAELVMRTLEKAPSDRPASVAELLEVIAAFDGAKSGEMHRSGPSLWRTMRRMPLLASGGVAVAVLGGLTFYLLRPRGPAIDDKLIAAAPFRVASADPSLRYLREGMIDLLATKLTTQTLRMADPRSVVHAFRAASTSSDEDLPEDRARRVARALGAGQLLLGDVVGTPSKLVLSVRLLDVNSGRTGESISVEGSPDSLVVLVDRMTVALLKQIAPEESQRMGNITTNSVVALRSYLEGQALLRKASSLAAANAFKHAIDADSNFALAGIGLRLAAAWYGDNNFTALGTTVAWRNKAQLNPIDQGLLVALAGSNYPGATSSVQRWKDIQNYVAMAPQRAEAWYLYADYLYHFGHIVDSLADEHALAAFNKSIDLDSTYTPAAIHLIDLAVKLGDFTSSRRAERLRLAADTARYWVLEHRWYEAVKTGKKSDAAVLFDSLRKKNPFRVVQTAANDGTGAPEAWVVLDSMYRGAQNGSRAAVAQVTTAIAEWSLVFGRPSLNRKYLLATDSGGDINVAVLKVRNAMIGDGDSTLAADGMKTLAREESRAPNDSASRAMLIRTIRATEPYRLANGDTSRTRRSIEQMRAALAGSPLGREPESQASFVVIEAMFANIAKRPDAGAAIERLDSLMREVDYNSVHAGRAAFENLTVARLFEQRGDYKRALAAVRRHGDRYTGGQDPYRSTLLREEGRFAALTGDVNGALKAYRHYLALRYQVERVLQPQVDAVRLEVARLEAQLKGK